MRTHVSVSLMLLPPRRSPGDSFETWFRKKESADICKKPSLRRTTSTDRWGSVLCHAEDEADPWLICTDREAGYATIRTYSRRMWIEQPFADLEDGGFHLNRSRIYPPERLSRLVMALAWTYM